MSVHSYFVMRRLVLLRIEGSPETELQITACVFDGRKRRPFLHRCVAALYLGNNCVRLERRRAI